MHRDRVRPEGVDDQNAELGIRFLELQPCVAEFDTQVSSKEAKVLVYNEQTSTAVTTNIKRLASKAGVPTVGVTETVVPATASYQQWLGDELRRLETALGTVA